MDAHGMEKHRMNACGYSLGAKFTPTWMDFPMFYHGNPIEIEPDQVFFAHMILMDSESGNAYCLGRTYITTKAKPKRAQQLREGGHTYQEIANALNVSTQTVRRYLGVI